MRPSARALAIAAAFGLALCGTGCATWQRFVWEGLGRERWQKPDAVIALLGIEPGDAVSDWGDGYFVLRLSEAVGASGRVYKTDADDGVYHYVKRAIRERGIGNVSLRERGAMDPIVVTGADLLFFCNIYHEFLRYPERIEMLHSLYQPSDRIQGVTTLAPTGRVAIVEYDGRSWLARISGHFTSAETIEREMRQAGYERIARYELPRQSFQIFRPGDGDGEPE